MKQNQEKNYITHKIRVYGIVQGVGFRPTVSRHAMTAGITGSVCNFGPYVEIFAQGSEEQVALFEKLLVEQPPKRAAILKVDIKEADEADFPDFQIIESGKTSGEIFISPDIATCDDCKRELYDPSDRRFRHPFINCTCCGPRLTILDALPYDRERTSMKEFPMCPDCAQEYYSPATRRYDAQPVCCNECGPEVYILTAGGEKETSIPREVLQRQESSIIRDLAAITHARRIISEGGIVAIKGIGGFHLCCDATNEQAVALLRTRKNRPAKPFAVMMRDMEAVQRECSVNALQEEILTGHQKPILLLERRSEDEQIAPSVAPDNPKLGVMLPYAPLHMLLFHLPDAENPEQEADGIRMPDCLVMTSGNISGAPICRDDRDAEKELRHLCDAILSHNRLIRIRADDTVMDIFEDHPYMIRRSRGYAPLPFLLAMPMKGQVLAIGGELKNSFCVATNGLFYPSPYVGDLGDYRTVQALKETVDRFLTLLEVEPQAVVCDLHPKYNSTAAAMEMGLPTIQVQHHYAHILSCMAENDCLEPVIGVSFDGTGYGSDGTIWGGEILEADVHGFRRAGSIKPFLQIGGDASAKEGWRIAVSMIYSLTGDKEETARIVQKLGLCDEKNLKVQLMMADRRMNAVTSTSAGRLFDAVSAILGIRRCSSFEGEASTQLMFAAERWEKRCSEMCKCSDSASLRKFTSPAGQTEAPEEPTGTGQAEASMNLTGKNRHENLREYLGEVSEDGLLPTDHLVRSILEARLEGEDTEHLAWIFHEALAVLVTEACLQVREGTERNRVALSGGVYQNLLLTRMTTEHLREEGFEVLLHSMVPPNDGGIALGQALYGMLNPLK